MSPFAFQSLSLKRKLILIILLTSVIVLVLACAAFVAYDQVTFRRAMRDDLSTLAVVIAGNNWGALSVDNTDGAEKSLATLLARPQILSASFYDTAGKPFGDAYIRPGSGKMPIPEKPGAD